MIREMLNRMLHVVRDEQGIETLEWIAMAFLIIVLVAIVAYPGGLLPAIQGVIGNITAAL
jgi:Flp pilus assembly pilin Flp